jgi:hypothetical protein
MDWYSKQQSTIESSVLGSEFVALKTGMGKSFCLHYKLQIMGILVTGPTYTFGDRYNMSVIFNTSAPESTLRKKAHSICYHAVQEAVPMEDISTAHKPSITHPANIVVKVLPGRWRASRPCEEQLII